MGVPGPVVLQAVIRGSGPFCLVPHPPQRVVPKGMRASHEGCSQPSSKGRNVESGTWEGQVTLSHDLLHLPRAGATPADPLSVESGGGAPRPQSLRLVGLASPLTQSPRQESEDQPASLLTQFSGRISFQA